MNVFIWYLYVEHRSQPGLQLLNRHFGGLEICLYLRIPTLVNDWAHSRPWVALLYDHDGWSAVDGTYGREKVGFLRSVLKLYCNCLRR
jgi:hypothetical protein